MLFVLYCRDYYYLCICVGIGQDKPIHTPEKERTITIYIIICIEQKRAESSVSLTPEKK